ncbi:MAG: SpoIIE family protein phosphatase [Acidobacteria bacterium]|nr:SpoIIE family protein phosphatase [Acidobacteriota bacterium]
MTVRTPDGKSRVVPLTNPRLTLGRSATNDLCYPEDVGLSRQHLAFERSGVDWVIQDLGSKNGTLVNGARITTAQRLRPGDRISAGHLNIEFTDVTAAIGGTSNTVVFVDSAVVTAATTTVSTSLEGLMGPEQEDFGKTNVFQGSLQTRALLRAGRELAGHRPLAELFEVIMDLSLEAVGTNRGVLMTLEDGALVVKAARGQGFQISSAVRDKVITEGASVLVMDAQLDQAFRERASIVAQNVRSMMAVPLQAKDRVIGLIYLDSPNLVRPFSREDLNLLTVMANVAAIRIEHARLAEVEQAERMLAKELEQAAKIQRGLLPAQSPQAPGLDLAGSTAACRTVGGDYYDFLSFPDGRVGVLVGDVAGKGMPAALMMSSLQARVQVLFEECDDLARSVSRLNKAIATNCPDNRFITFFICIIDPATGVVTYSNAGHNPPLLVRRSGEVDTLKTGGIILGIMPRFTYQDDRVTMGPGDILVLFSDGVTEAARPDVDEEFGETRLAEVVRAHASEPAEEIVKAVLAAVAQFTQGAPAADDITVVVAKR